MRASPFASDTSKMTLPRLFVRRQRIEVTMGGQWLRRRGEKEQKGIGDDRLEKTVSGRYREREAKRGTGGPVT